MLVFIGIVWNSCNEITGTSFKKEQKLPHELVSKKDLLSYPWAEGSSKVLENISGEKPTAFFMKMAHPFLSHAVLRNPEEGPKANLMILWNSSFLRQFQ